ncbi:S8 family serine peptidase [Streptomyces sp. NBC_00063]|uniref:S8 family serine peptidase n=1 Tax=Streptomyces sp. NBC_00063 TaxID=2975638 RepID=UPI003D740273
MSRIDRVDGRATPVGRSRRHLACLVVVGVVGAGLTLAPNAGAQDGPTALTAIKGAKAPTPARTLTLVTGDKLQVTTDAKSKLNVVALPERGRPAPVLNVEQSNDGDLHVTPESAEPLIAANRLDPDLFNVTKLLKYGYDDKKTSAIPLIATYGKSTKSTKDLRTPEGAEKVHRIGHLHTATFRTQKAKADEVFDDLQATGTTLADGMTKLWLDKPVKAADVDWNVSRIGAPDAWVKGLDGKGVSVAVLDTGIDATHPDLAGKIKKTENFTDEPSVADGFGHGTHVAATIAGSGAASDGQHSGVAPGADLYIGKVLNSKGSGTDSDVLAGMDWAAHSGAKIVSMSLGGGAGADGTDPLSQAVNQLSEETGTLFVIAAGNSGRSGTDTVGAPGAAADALTVGAVDSDGKIADFSSRGPLKDGRLKPDVTAPGVGIISARAAGTSMPTSIPVGELYTQVSGTSMATPHVAGSAAIVAQAHPDWTGQQIKAALAGTAEPGQEAVTTDGTGEIRVQKAIAPPVVAQSAALTYPVVPNEQTDKINRELTYTNSTDSPVTLNLKADFTFGGAPAADGIFTLSDAQLTIPAKGTATATLTFDPAKAAVGRYTGVVTATGDGGVSVRTLAGVAKDIPRTTIELPVTRHNGSHDGIGGEITVFGLDRTAASTVTKYPITPGVQPKISVPRGRYLIMAHLLGYNSSGTVVERDLLGDTAVNAYNGGTVTVPLDASKARKVEMRGEKPGEVRYREFGIYRSYFNTDGSLRLFSSRYLVPDQWREDLYIGAMSGKGNGFFTWSERSVWYRQDTEAEIVGGGEFDPQPVWQSPAARGEHRYRVVPVGKATAADIAGKDLKGAIVLVDRIPDTTYASQTAALKAAGAAAVLLAGPDGSLYADMQFASALPAYTVTKTEADRLRRSGTEVDIDYNPDSPYLYDLVLGGQDSSTDKVTVTAKDEDMARVDAEYNSTSGTKMFGDIARQGAYGNVNREGAYAEQIQLPMKRTEYLMPGIQFTRLLLPLDSTPAPFAFQTNVNPAAGDVSHESWLKPGIAPFVGNGVLYRRFATQLGLNARTWGDSSGKHYGQPIPAADVVGIKWYRNGELQDTAAGFEIHALNISSEEADYRLETDVKRENQARWAYSTHMNTAWTFKASSTLTPDLPAPRYDIPTDGYGKLRGGKSTTFTLATGKNPKSAEVSFSYDGGTTWKKADSVTQRADGTWAVTLHLPKAKDVEDGKASMRLEAANTAGDTVTQTITDAFGVK